jgi:hypothetical protein
MLCSPAKAGAQTMLCSPAKAGVQTMLCSPAKAGVQTMLCSPAKAGVQIRTLGLDPGLRREARQLLRKRFPKCPIPS